MRQLARASDVGHLNDIVKIARHRRASYDPTKNKINDPDVFTKLNTDILPFVLQFISLDEINILMWGKCKLMLSNVIISLSEMGKLELFADYLFSSILGSKLKSDDSRRQTEWNFFTFRGHVRPHTFDPAGTVNPDEHSREYMYLTYIRYVLHTHAEWYQIMTGDEPSTELYIMMSNLDLKIEEVVWRIHIHARENHPDVDEYRNDFSQIAQDLSDVYRWHFEVYLQLLIMDQPEISDIMIVELQDDSDIV